MSEKLETLGDLVEINGAVTNEPLAQDQEPPVAQDQDSSNEDQVDTKTEEGAAEDSQSVNEDDASANDGEGEKDIKSQLDEAFDALTEGVKPKNEGQDAQPKDQKQDQIKQPEPKTEPNKSKTEAEEDAEGTTWHGGEILGKPRDRDDARRMLKILSGAHHLVTTGVTLRSAARMTHFTSLTYVWFRTLTDEEIAYYVDTFQPFDKAGAYGIQEWIGYAAIECIEGSFYNVMGLPVQKVYTELDKFLNP